MRPPDTVCIAITFADGSVGLMRFITAEYGADGTPTWTRQATKGTVDAEIARAQWRPELLPIKGWRPVAESDVPKDRTYRNALRDTGSALVHDLDAVKALALAQLRQDRAVMFGDLDWQWNRAMGQGDSDGATAIEAQRQALRDLPATVQPDLDAAAAPEDVTAACVPAIAAAKTAMAKANIKPGGTIAAPLKTA